MKRKPYASFLTYSRNTERSAVIWNAASACISSFQTMLLLMAVTRFGPAEHSGAFVMAFTAANLFMNLGKFGMRQYQVTDAGNSYTWREYASSRVFSVALMAAGLGVYLLWGLLWNGYTAEKAAVIALITFYRGVDAAEDVLHGRMQQQGRLDAAAKVLTIRSAAFMAGFAILYLITKNLVLTCAVNAAVTLALSVALNRAAMGALGPEAARDADRRTGGIPWGLIRDCLPLCLTMVTYMYLSNAPKYIIDGIVSDAAQTRFNIVMMPAFVCSLLCSFIFNPLLRRIGVLWQEGKTGELRGLVRRLALVPTAVDAALLLGGWFLGIPLLSLVYQVDLDGYRTTLMIFLLSSGVIAMLNLFVALLTAMRKQRWLLWTYAAASLILLALGRPLLKAWGPEPLCWFYLAVLGAVLVWCVGIYLKTVKKKNASAGQAETFD